MSEEVNILTGGVEVLTEMKASLLQLDELKVRSGELTQKQQRLDKEIAAKQKALETEISTTLSKRKTEIEKTYDGQLEQTRERIKKVRAKRDKLKTTKVGERISLETADMHEEIRSMKQDIKGIYSREHIPRIFNTEYFFSLYMPDGIGDFLIILLSIIIVLAVPSAIYFVLPVETRNIWLLVALYVGIISLVLLVFTFIFKRVRTHHLQGLQEAKQLRDKIKDTGRQIRKKAARIRKDKDESTYGLEKYDEEMAELDKQVEDIVNEKKLALKTFETQAGNDLTEEIKARYNTDLDELKRENEAAYDEQRTAQASIKSLSLEISRKYEAYIGRENLSVPIIENLIDIINNQEAANIADALNYYKRMISETKKEQ